MGHLKTASNRFASLVGIRHDPTGIEGLRFGRDASRVIGVVAAGGAILTEVLVDGPPAHGAALLLGYVAIIAEANSIVNQHEIKRLEAIQALDAHIALS